MTFPRDLPLPSRPTLSSTSRTLEVLAPAESFGLVALNSLRISLRYDSMLSTYRLVWRCLLLAQIEIESSLMMYPIPNPSPDTGPKPKCRNAGFPQFEVLSIVLLILSHPESLNSAGIWCNGGAGERLVSVAALDLMGEFELS